MYDLELQHRARQDLKEIWRFSCETWNEQQADKYLRQLAEKTALLRTNPNLGRRRDEVRPGYRSLVVNRHVVYYLVEEDSVRIVRVLHDGMDPERHL